LTVSNEDVKIISVFPSGTPFPYASKVLNLNIYGYPALPGFKVLELSKLSLLIIIWVAIEGEIVTTTLTGYYFSSTNN